MNQGHPHLRRIAARGFTLLELITSMAVLSILLIMLLQTVVQTQNIWTRTRSRVEEFREARVAFESITRRLSQATLNSVWDYDNATKPTRYVRQSDLHFVTGPAVRTGGGEGLLQNVDGASGHAVFFQAPLGFTGKQAGQATGTTLDNLENLLDGWGYYVKYTSDLPDRPSFLRSDTAHNPERLTFSLMEFRQASEGLPVFLQDVGGTPFIKSQTSGSGLFAWFRSGQMGGFSPQTDQVNLDTGSRVLARNVLALIISPRLPSDGVAGVCDYDIAPNYYYDSREFQLSSPINTGTDRNGTQLTESSRHQLPPMLDLTLVAVDDPTWTSFLNHQGDHQKYLDFIKSHFASVGPIAARGSSSYESTLHGDLNQLQSMLTADHINFRVFSSSVQIRAAKWTTDADLPAH